MKNKFSAFLSIFAFSFLFSSCEFLFPELINQDKTTIIGDNYVYAGSTIRLTPVIEAPNYQGRKVDITVLSSDDKIAEAYFTSSCTGYEFIVEGVKSGEINVKFIVKDYFTKNELSKLCASTTIKVVDDTSLSFTEKTKTVTRGEDFSLEINNPEKLPVKITSSNGEIITVSENGLLHANKTGVTGVTVSSENGLLNSTCIVTVKSDVKADKFFWGEWISMGDGSVMWIQEEDVMLYARDDTEKKNGKNDAVISSDSEKIILENAGTFEKKSQNVIQKDKIPYFRNGGTNLTYKLKLVGFESEEHFSSPVENSSERKASVTRELSYEENSSVRESSKRAPLSVKPLGDDDLSGIKVTGTSDTFTGYESEAVPNENGIVVLNAPVSGDTQTVTITTKDGNAIIIPGLKIENSGESIGTVPVVKKGEYTLKITGKIDENEKISTGGYLCAGNKYKMTLTITNVSEVKSGAGVISVKPSDSSLSLSSSEDLNGIPVSTMLPGASKSVELYVTCNSISESFIDTGLDITVTNAKTSVSPERTWNDFVPVRFFKKLVPVTVSAKSAENNGSVLHSFIIFPDGNSAYFEVKDNASKTINIPSYGEGKDYKLVFCGADASVIMSETTEMHYSVNIGSNYAEKIVTEGENLTEIMGFGEPNETEDSAFQVNGSFQAYAGDDDIDFYSFSVN